MNIEVGMYIRTKEWGIAKVHKIADGKCIFIRNKNNRITHYFTQIGHEPSYRIIDLLEKGDYVNDNKVKRKSINPCANYIDAPLEKVIYVETGVGYTTEQIKSIVTKEQFESMKYIVGE